MVNDPRVLLKEFLLRKKWAYTFSILSIIISEFITVQFPNVIGKFTNRLSRGHMTGADVANYAWKLAVIGILYVLFYGFGQFRNGQIGRSFEYELRKKLFLHWETLHTGYFRSRSVGDLLNHAMNDVRAVREVLSGGLNILTNAIFLLIAALWMTLRTISVKLTLVSMIPLVLVPVFIIWWGPRTRHASRRVQEALSKMADMSEESLSSIRVIKTTGNEAVETSRFTQTVDHIVKQQMDLYKRTAVFQSVIPFMGSLSFAVALIYGGYITLAGQIELGMFVAFTLYLAMIITPLQQIGFVINNFQRAAASLGRLRVLLLELPEIVDAPDAIDLQDVRGEIHMALTAFTYPDAETAVLNDVNFHIRPGTTLGIVGRTGAGKTTLVNLLPRIFDPSPGSVFLDGIDVRRLTLASLRRAIAYVPQDGFLFSAKMSTNIGFGKLHPEQSEIEEKAKDVYLYEEIMNFSDQFDTEIGERGIALSGGQKQRTAMARALLKEAPVLILDDSLSAVDMVTEKQIIERIKELRAGKTTLIVAHRLSAVHHAEQIIVLDKGKVSARGTHAELIDQNGIYAEMWRMQSEGIWD